MISFSLKIEILKIDLKVFFDYLDILKFNKLILILKLLV